MRSRRNAIRGPPPISGPPLPPPSPPSSPPTFHPHGSRSVTGITKLHLQMRLRGVAAGRPHPDVVWLRRWGGEGGAGSGVRRKEYNSMKWKSHLFNSPTLPRSSPGNPVRFRRSAGGKKTKTNTPPDKLLQFFVISFSAHQPPLLLNVCLSLSSTTRLARSSPLPSGFMFGKFCSHK